MSSGDLTGRKGMAGNVLASWAGQSVFIVAGFILPHMIDRRLGPSLLGVWDFAWSLVSYFSLVQVGVVSSISRYVAMHRAQNDTPGISRATSSVMCLLSIMTAVILALTAVALLVLGRLRHDELAAYMTQARWVILLLGIEIAAQTIFSVYAGVITGFHRWGIQNGITAGAYFFTAAAMIISLLCGGGLCALALIHLIGEVIAGVIRYFMAYKICPGLRISYSNANRQTVSSMFHYGAKSWVPSIGDLILNQTTSVLIGVSLGPVPLAIYSRSRSLVRYARDLVAKMAGVLVASVSSLHAAGEHEQIQELVIKSTRYSAFLSFPIGMLLIICGGPLVSIWMGSRYAAPGVAATFALGQTAAVLQLPALAILAGMNKHGRLAFANLVGSILSVGAVAWAVCWLKAGLFPIALAATVPLLMVNAIYGPLHTCRCLNLPISKYLKKAYFNPLVWTLPFGLCLLASRWWFGDHEKLSVMVGGAVGGAVLAPIYWLNVAPPSIKSAIRKRFRRTPAPPALEENAVRTTI